jgi:hypothetical protein
MDSKAGKRYQRRVLTTMAVYAGLLVGSVYLIKHVHIQGLMLYVVAVVPAVPILAVFGWMGRYLQEETDEYQRWLVMQSILVGAALLLGAVVVSDFLRAFAATAGLSPFVGFLIFCGGMAGMQFIQRLRNRVSADE